MHIIIDTILILLLLLIFLICGGELANALGGSLVFPIFIITTSLFSQIYKKYQIEVSAVGIILLTLLLTNFVDYLDKANKLQFIWIILIYCSVYFAGIAAFIFLALRPLLPIGDNANKAEFVELKMRIFARLSFFPLISLFVFCIPTAFPYFYLGLADRRFVDKDLVRYIPICTFWLTFSFLVTHILIWKIKEVFSLLTKENTEIKFKYYNALFLSSLGIIIILGSGLEIARGAWFLWIESILLVIMIFSTLWCIWRFVLSTNSKRDIHQHEIILPPLFEYKPLIIIILISSILATIYLGSLGVILVHLFGKH